MTTWNPSDKSATIALSNGNNTATSVTAVIQAVRSTTGRSSGLWFFEITTVTSTPDTGIGLATAAYNLADADELGGATGGHYSMGFYPIFPTMGIFANNVELSTGTETENNGDVVSFAINFNTQKAWITSPKMRGEGHPWNNNATDNPATLTGGIDLSVLAAGPFYIAFCDDNGGAVMTLNTAGPFSVTVPTNFFAWDSPTTTITLPPASGTSGAHLAKQGIAPGMPHGTGTAAAHALGVNSSAPPPTPPPPPPTPPPPPPVPTPAESATAIIVPTQVDSAHWQYTISLTDTGNTSIGTFWFGWIPGENLMNSSPSSIVNPTGWTSTITHSGTSDGFGVQWTTTTPISMTTTVQGFTFVTTDSPTVMFGNSPFYPSTPIVTSFVYSGAPFSDAGYEFAASFTPVPTPAPPPVPAPPPTVTPTLFTAWWQAMMNEIVSNKDILHGFTINNGDPQGLTGGPDFGVIGTTAAPVIGTAFRSIVPPIPVPAPPPVPVPAPPPPAPPPPPPPPPAPPPPPVPAPPPAPTPPPPAPPPVPVPAPPPAPPTPAPPPVTSESPNGTTLNSASGQIIDASINIWTLGPISDEGFEVYKNGVLAGVSANVILLLYWNHTVYQENSSLGWWSWTGSTWLAASGDPRPASPPTPVPTPPAPPPGPTPVGSVGPAASGTFINVDFTNQSGQIVSQYIWGVADGGNLGNQGFTNFNDGTLAPLLTRLAYPLYRFNSQCGYTERLFPGGSTSLSESMASEFGTLISRFPVVCPGARLIMGLGFGPDNWGSASAYASVCQQIATYFNTNAPGLVYGWEVGNENNEAGYYNSYFNAAAVAIKGVNANFRMFGPVFSYADDLNTFASGSASHCDVLDYHNYAYGGESDFASKGGQSYLLNSNLLNNGNGSAVNNALASYVSGGGSSSTPVFIGEWNGNNTYGTANGGASPGVCNTYMQNGTSACFNANTILSGVNSSPNFAMAAIWSIWTDSDYGVIGGTDNVNGGGAYGVCPGGWLLSQAGKTVYGKRANVSLGANGHGTNLAVSGGTSAAGFAVMLINTGAAMSGQVALSHWPVNSTGNGTINYWQVGDSNPNVLNNTVAVTNGLTATISVPANSVVILWSP